MSGSRFLMILVATVGFATLAPRAAPADDVMNACADSCTSQNQSCIGGCYGDGINACLNECTELNRVCYNACAEAENGRLSQCEPGGPCAGVAY